MIPSKPIYQNGKTRLFVFLLTILSFVFTTVNAQDAPDQYGTPFQGVPDTRDAVIYQVNMRAFSPTSDFQGVINRLDNIKALGVNVIYLMPVFPVGTDSKSFNSPYAVKDFKSVGSEFGDLNDLRALVDGAHTRGMAVIMDWIANQTSWDHPWITEHPDWYIRDANGVIQQFSTYTDVAALDLSNPAVRAEMIDAMRYWVFNANVDGFRLDFADAPAIDFWQEINSSLRAITSHKLLLLAEGTRSANYSAGFDYNFGMHFYYNSLLSIFDGGSATLIDQSNIVEYNNATGKQQITRYLTNHDVNSSDGTPLELFGGKEGSMAAFVVVAYMKGVPFIYNGQEVAFPTRITFPFTSVDIDWTINPDVLAEYTKVIAFRNSSDAIRRGTLASYTTKDVAAFTKTLGAERVFVLSNLRNAASDFTVPPSLVNTKWKDAYTGSEITLGTTVSLTPYQYLTLVNANASHMANQHITVWPEIANIVIGAKQQITATLTPANSSNQKVLWSSSDTSVAKVDASGLVTGIAEGTATITATKAQNQKTAASIIKVSKPYTFTVNFYKPSNWGTGINIYYWATEPAGTIPEVSWPGVRMTDNGDGWYTYAFTNVNFTNLIFNDGSKQTGNLSRGKTGWYLSGVWYDTKPVVSNSFTVNFYRPTGWGTDINIYHWAAEPAGSLPDASWPGVRMNNNGDGWYSYTFINISSTNLIFNDGSSQTANLSRNKTGWYLDGVWYDTKPVISSSFTVNFYKPASWATGIRVYYWGAEPAGSLPEVSWPGVVMSDNGGGWYSYTFNNVAFTNLIFNDGAGNQTANLSRERTGWYMNGTWYDANPQTARLGVTSEEVGAIFSSVDMFPNPAKGNVLNLKVSGMKNNERATITIVDSHGMVVLKTAVLKSANLEHNLRSGVYFVKVAGNGINVTKKLIVD